MEIIAVAPKMTMQVSEVVRDLAAKTIDQAEAYATNHQRNHIICEECLKTVAALAITA